MSEHDPIAEKYKNKVTPEWRAGMQAIGMAANILSQHRERYEALLKAKHFMDNVGFILDPTLARDAMYSKSLPLQLRLATAAIAFLNEYDAVGKELPNE
jgi:hypothetical protein